MYITSFFPQGPAYDVEHKHGFTKEENISEKVTSLQGPAFDVEHGHKYPAEGKLEVSGQPPPREQQYPVMETEHKSEYKPTMEPGWKEPAKHKELKGPKFEIDRWVDTGGAHDLQKLSTVPGPHLNRIPFIVVYAGQVGFPKLTYGRCWVGFQVGYFVK